MSGAGFDTISSRVAPQPRLEFPCRPRRPAGRLNIGYAYRKKTNNSADSDDNAQFREKMHRTANPVGGNMKTKLILATTCALLLCSCAITPSDPADLVRSFTVELDPQPAAGKLKVKSKAQGWRRTFRKDGYVGFAKGESGDILFEVKKGDSESCSDGAEWVISKLELTVFADPYKKESGRDFGESQENHVWLKKAFPQVDLQDGSVSGTLDRTQFRLTVDNAQRNDEVAYYKVTVTPCEGGDALATDPIIRNGGKGHN
jgi:hypothetical protein